MRILGIETSCDETGIAIYDSEKGLIHHEIHSQLDVHAAYGGVVPELASRDHIQKIIPLIKKTLKESNLSLQAINGIAYTAGPGLMGALLVGTMVARSLGMALKIPTIGVHHLEGHLLAPFLEPNPPAFPFLALLISGGHTQLVKVLRLGHYQIIGDTLDDAIGEAFDKTAKLLGLGYPGGALLAKLAQLGDPTRFHFPRPMIDRPGLDFSFSGLKTFALNTILKNGLDDKTKADIARAFEDAVVETMTIKCRRALLKTKLRRLVVAGGVGANLSLRRALKQMCEKNQAQIYFPRLEFCTDNGAMIAYVGCQRLMLGQADVSQVNPRWSLEDIKL